MVIANGMTTSSCRETTLLEGRKKTYMLSTRSLSTVKSLINVEDNYNFNSWENSLTINNAIKCAITVRQA
jgi:hypothetical protein